MRACVQKLMSPGRARQRMPTEDRYTCITADAAGCDEAKEEAANWLNTCCFREPGAVRSEGVLMAVSLAKAIARSEGAVYICSTSPNVVSKQDLRDGGQEQLAVS